MFSGQVLGKDLGSSTLKIKIKYEKTFFNQKDYDIHNQLPFFCLQNENSKKVASFNLITTLDTNLGSSTLKMKIKCENAFLSKKTMIFIISYLFCLQNENSKKVAFLT